MCGTCGCKIVYNGRFSDPEEQPVETYSAKKNKLTGKQILIIAGVVAVFVIVLIVAGASNRPSEKSGGYYYTPQTNAQETGTNTPGNPAVYDWMERQAQGKDYDSDDGGSYYCMGKNDTCPNKTHDKYDLYCDSCDPDGDNVEG